jgi:protein tyrosine phosphatase (PTP) superfamily phosphohydrolase (DUF442 family)
VQLVVYKVRSLKKPTLGAGCLSVLTIGFLWFIGVFGGNLRCVDEGQIYRSAQLSDGNLRTAISERRIRSIINLRGPQGNDPKYRSELAISRELGLTHEDVALSATHLPPPQELSSLLRALDTLPHPILVHCLGGADRSGLVSTLYLNVYKHVSLDQAEKQQLTWRYGHFSWFSARPMDEFFDLYRATGHGENLREWISKTYPAIYDEKFLSAKNADQHL